MLIKFICELFPYVSLNTEGKRASTQALSAFTKSLSVAVLQK